MLFISSVMNSVMQEGKTVWLPMPSVYKGLNVNKTLSQKNIITAALRMAERKLTVCHGYSNVLKGIREINKEDGFVMIPFLRASGNESWVTTLPFSYLGINLHTVEAEKKWRCIKDTEDIFQYCRARRLSSWIRKAKPSCLTSEIDGYHMVETAWCRFVLAVDNCPVI